MSARVVNSSMQEAISISSSWRVSQAFGLDQFGLEGGDEVSAIALSKQSATEPAAAAEQDWPVVRAPGQGLIQVVPVFCVSVQIAVLVTCRFRRPLLLRPTHAALLAARRATD